MKLHTSMRSGAIIVFSFFIFFNAAFAFKKIKCDSCFSPANKFYVGLAVGTNTISSHFVLSQQGGLQGGLSVEYYFHKNFSCYAGLQAHKVGVSFDFPDSHTGGFFNFGHDAYSGTFESTVTTMPLGLKYEFNIYQSFRGNISVGLRECFENNPKYANYTANCIGNRAREYTGNNFAMGFNYLSKTRLTFGANLDLFGGPARGLWPGSLVSNERPINMSNSMLTFSLKYSPSCKEKIAR